MAEDRWLRWQAEAAGTAPRPHLATLLVLMFLVVAAALIFLAPSPGGADPAPGSPSSPARTRSSACAELHRLERAGVHHGPEFWAVQPACHAGH